MSTNRDGLTSPRPVLASLVAFIGAEGRIVVTHKKRGMRVYLAEFEQPDIEMSTHSSRINRRNIVQAHLRANAQRDAVGLCLKSAPKSIRCDAETDGLFSISDEPPCDTRVPVGELSTASIADIAGGATIPATQRRGAPGSGRRQAPGHNPRRQIANYNGTLAAIP